jgi:hypothetical protein
LTEAETGMVATTLTPTASMEAAPTTPKARRRFKFFFTSKYLSCFDRVIRELRATFSRDRKLGQ